MNRFSSVAYVQRAKIMNYDKHEYLQQLKSGKVLKCVSEYYLRDDIPCGSLACSICLQNSDQKCQLEEKPVRFSTIYPFSHYLVLDTNIILHQIDALEENVFTNVIIFETVFQEVKHRSLLIYNKLFNLINDSSRHFYLFPNEFHFDTYVSRSVDQTTINDRNDNAIILACIWYEYHLRSTKIRIVFVTDDEECRRKADQFGLHSCSILNYAQSLSIDNAIEEKLSKNVASFTGDGKNLFPNHFSEPQMYIGIRNGSLLKGTFQASRYNYLEGFVILDDETNDRVIIKGHEALNRAIHGDIVAVELLPENQWVAPSDFILEDNQNVDPNNITDLLEQEELLSKPSIEKVKKTGRIVGIVTRKWRQYCGILQKSIVHDAVTHLFVPADRMIPKIRIETRQYDYLKSQKIVVSVDSWPRSSRYPIGHFVRALGTAGEKETENQVILLEHDIPHSSFAENVLSCLPKLPWTINEEDLKGRVDLRSMKICSVDPPGCTDIDDALHCRPLKNGNFEVGVHIADVSHFVKVNSALDKEAQNRATTVYLVGKRIDMVPELLSSNLCSLRANEDRFAFSVVWEMDKNCNMTKKPRFHKSIIRSQESFTYEQAQLRIDDASKNDPITASLRTLNDLAKVLKQKRKEKGALLLASPEIRFKIDDETQDPLEVESKSMFETNSMVEEFMLLANITVAEKILEEFPECSVLRRHPEPPESNFESLIKAAKHMGFKINVSSGKELAESLDSAVKDHNPYFNTMLRIIATRCMYQAVYFCSGSCETKSFHHYGLAVPIYTHFTSPIRRYADIMVHRLLAATTANQQIYPELLDKLQVQNLCNNLNYRKRMADYAGRASVALNTHLFLKEKDQIDDGYILMVKKNALQILIPKYGIECLLYLEKKESNIKFVFNEEEQSQCYGDVKFFAFDKIKVRISLNCDNIQHEKIIVNLVDPKIPGFSD